MDRLEDKLHRMSLNQLRTLLVLAKSEHQLVSSSATGKTIGVLGKSLGGVYSSLSRQQINGKRLIIPWGKGEDGRGLRWRLNDEFISVTKLKQIITKLLQFDLTNM